METTVVAKFSRWQSHERERKRSRREIFGESGKRWTEKEDRVGGIEYG